MMENVSRNGMESFENPDSLPLEELKLKIKTDGVIEIVPALNERWMEKHYFLHYEAPEIYDNGAEIMGAKEHWMEVISYIIDDLEWLLSLPFYRFWSNVIYNTSILDTLVSFLQKAPPFYALENFPNVPEMLELLEALRRNVLVIFARLVTNKESPVEFMKSSFLGDLLYDNYIFTVPIIFDLCQLYGRENSKVMEKMLTSLFTLQPLYNADLQKSVPYLIEALENVEQKFDKRSGLPEMTLVVLEDLILYVLDISSTLTVLFKNYPPAISKYHVEDFMNKIVSIYENTIPEIYKRLDKLAYTDESMPKYMELKHRMDVTRVELLHLFRMIIYNPVHSVHLKLHLLAETEIKSHVDDYLNLLSNAIAEKEFITDYHQLYPVDVDLEVLSKLCPEVDTIKCDYLLQSIYAIIGDLKVPVTNSINHTAEPVAGPSGTQNNQLVPCSASTSGTSTTVNKTESIVKDSVELASLIYEVKDILPHLGEGFIEICLKYYNYDSASVINAILEDTLSQHLKEIDFMLPHIPPDPMEASAAVDLALGVERLNVFDNDEFDVMTRDFIDTTRVHKGKRKDKYKDINEMLNDKTDIRKTREFYNKYSIVSDDYDDEYDDTYDSHDVRGTTDSLLEVDSLEIKFRRGRKGPSVHNNNNNNEAASEEESEDEDEESAAQQNGKDLFIQNPAELRAKAEQRRQAARGGRASHNVVGKPRGRGQDKDVLINRDHKNVHKATQANHNRRAGAHWKRGQGMIPF